MRHFFLAIIMVFSAGFVLADPGKPQYRIIVDTDGALDDLRALTMLLADKDIDVSAITCSQGTLSPVSCFAKVNALKKSFFHEGIPVGVGRNTNTVFPPWNSFAESIIWGDSIQEEVPKTAGEVITNVINNTKDRIVFIAMGPLTTFADWIKDNKSKISRVDKIIWYGGPAFKTSFNYRADTVSYEVIKSSAVPLFIVSNGAREVPCGTEYMTKLKTVHSVYAGYLRKVLSQEGVAGMLLKKHSQLWDDLLPLFLSCPAMFIVSEGELYKKVEIKKEVKLSAIYDNIAKLLVSKNEAMNRVFRHFPAGKQLYKTEYASLFPSVPYLYGLAEWKAIVLTNEVHGHTGIFSIIGAKAGIRACEYFNVGVNELQAVSYVGNTPPLSCFNDGIQISTGATIGQGLITVSDTVLDVPAITFMHEGQKVKFVLKESIAKQMKDELKSGIREYGMSVKYWEYVEDLAKKYWEKYNRHEIFDIQKF